MATSKVDLWVDPVCPFAWMTSRWLIQVEQVRDVNVRFHIMSLAVLNEDRDDLAEEYKDLLSRAWGPVRVCIAGEKAGGPDALRALYTALGTRIHLQERTPDMPMYRESLIEAGLDPELADASAGEEYDIELRQSHASGMDPVGQEVGTPVIHAPGPNSTKVAFFGPVVIPAPKAEAAGKLWDGVLLVAGTDGFFELKRSRTRAPDFS